MICLTAVAISAAGQQPAGTQTIAVPGRANANVSLAADGRFVAMSWSASLASGGTDIFAAVSRDAGATFSEPVRVNDTPGEARVNGEQPPRVTLVSRRRDLPEVVVLWTAAGAAGTRLLTARSSDGGRTYSPTKLVSGTDAPGMRGWQALAADPVGRVHAVWLDHRRMAGHDMHAGPERSDLYFATLDEKAPAPQAITPSVCFCCKTALAAPREGVVFAAWRHVYPNNMRDMAFAASHDGGRTFSPPVRVSEDKWQLAGCPDDGPAMTVGSDGAIHLVWPTMTNQRISIFYATSTDGRRFTPRIELPTEGQARHPQLAVAADASLLAAWDESGDGRRQIVLARGMRQRDGSVHFEREVLDDGAGVYPAIAISAEGPLLAWTGGTAQTSTISVRRLAVSGRRTRFLR
jgi:hypothetical protein